MEKKLLCKQIFITSHDDIELTSSEKKLICGDDKNKAWEMIPINQASYFLKRALEARGYWRYKFDITEGQANVYTHYKTAFSQLSVDNDPVGIDLDRFWYPSGKFLTSDLLDRIEAFVTSELANLGHPCAKIETLADKDTGAIKIKIEDPGLFKVQKVVGEPISGAMAGVQRRFDAFRLEQDFALLKFELTSNRMVNEGLVIYSSFSPDCKNISAGVVEHKLNPGDPQLLSFGIGFDTEQYFITQSTWKNSRFTESASALQVTAFASYKLQQISSEFDWYYLPFPMRHYLKLQTSVKRLNENRYDEREFKISAQPSWQVDWSGSAAEISLGPNYRQIATTRGLAIELAKVVSIDLDVNSHTHDWEYFISSPRSGHNFDLQTSNAAPGLGSNIAVSSFSLRSTHLFNLFSYEPNLFVLGFRSLLGTTQVYGDTDVDEIPNSMKFRLGGTDTIRGFARERIPADDFGALSVLYLGSELRFANILPYNMQPYVFYDYGLIGKSAFEISTDTNYTSPGFGLRWESAFGPMRFSFGHGFVNGKESARLRHLRQWQFYFSYGGHF